MSQKLCKRCPNVNPEDHTFKIEILDCEGCVYNGAWSELDNEYIYDEATIEFLAIERTEAYEEGCCSFGECEGNGCYMFTCHQCGWKDNLHLMDS